MRARTPVPLPERQAENLAHGSKEPVKASYANSQFDGRAQTYTLEAGCQCDSRSNSKFDDRKTGVTGEEAHKKSSTVRCSVGRRQPVFLQNAHFSVAVFLECVWAAGGTCEEIAGSLVALGHTPVEFQGTVWEADYLLKTKYQASENSREDGRFFERNDGGKEGEPNPRMKVCKECSDPTIADGALHFGPGDLHCCVCGGNAAVVPWQKGRVKCPRHTFLGREHKDHSKTPAR